MSLRATSLLRAGSAALDTESRLQFRKSGCDHESMRLRCAHPHNSVRQRHVQMMHMALPEFAAMVKLQIIYPTSNLTLFSNESWKILLLMHELFQHEVASVVAFRQQSLHTPLPLVRPPLSQLSRSYGRISHPG